MSALQERLQDFVQGAPVVVTQKQLPAQDAYVVRLTYTVSREVVLTGQAISAGDGALAKVVLLGEAEQLRDQVAKDFLFEGVDRVGAEVMGGRCGDVYAGTGDSAVFSCSLESGHDAFHQNSAGTGWYTPTGVDASEKGPVGS